MEITESLPRQNDRVRLVGTTEQDGPGAVGTVTRVSTFDGVLVSVDWDDNTNSKVAPRRIVAA